MIVRTSAFLTLPTSAVGRHVYRPDSGRVEIHDRIQSSWSNEFLVSKEQPRKHEGSKTMAFSCFRVFVIAFEVYKPAEHGHR